MRKDSAYSAQLKKGFPLLSFEPALEREFRLFHLQAVRGRVITCLLIAVLFSLWAVFASRSGAAPSLEPDLAATLRRWVIRPLSIVLIITALTPWLYKRLWLRLAPLVIGMSGVVSAYSSAGVVVDGNYHAFVLMVSGLLGMLLLLGFLFWQVVTLGPVVAGSYVFFLAEKGGTPSVLGFEAAVLGSMYLLALVFSYNLEKSMRTTFLQMRILEDLGRLDSMTGLCNRGAFDESLEALWKQAIRDKKPLGLLLIDVDHFKNYNDAYGHQAGDRCLGQVADILKSSVNRPLDIAARIGGEEFALLCYASSPEYLHGLGKQIRARVRELDVPHTGSEVATCVTVSVGAVLVQPTVGRSTESFVQFADQALYDAKNAGRDRVIFRDNEYAAVVTGAFKM
ncbi:MAG: GGDEF domain-containing protein [Pseudomonadota bacterium]